MPHRIYRTTWYKPGLEHGNPVVNSRFRVNAPGAALDPNFAHRDEVRGNGMMQILIEEDLRQTRSAELQLVYWGGHPGTANKRVTINGRSCYALPETGTAQGHCTHGYPVIPLALTDLVNGYNALQFACDQGTSFWGHFIVDDAALRIDLPPDHPDLVRAGLSDVDATVSMQPVDPEHLRLALETTEALDVARVDYLGIYAGYDENGSGRTFDEHGFIKDRQRIATLGSATVPPFEVVWDRTMLPACQEVSVRAMVNLASPSGLELVTDTVQTPPIAHRGADVQVSVADSLPLPFWSRDGEAMSCTLTVPCEPADIERAEFHMVIWDGGKGTVPDPITLNGHPLEVAGPGAHDVRYRVLPLDPGLLQRGPNEVRVLSDTEHHGIEVLLPGPALVIRSRP